MKVVVASSQQLVGDGNGDGDGNGNGNGNKIEYLHIRIVNVTFC